MRCEEWIYIRNSSVQAAVVTPRGVLYLHNSAELATLQWAHWFNPIQLPEPIGYISPAEAETNDDVCSEVACRLKAEVRQRLLCGYSISSIEPKGVGIADLVLAMRAPCSKAADVHMGLPLGVVPHRATALKLSFGWFDPYGSVADDASADRVAASRLARSSLQSFGSSSRSSRTETR